METFQREPDQGDYLMINGVKFQSTPRYRLEKVIGKGAYGIVW